MITSKPSVSLWSHSIVAYHELWRAVILIYNTHTYGTHQEVEEPPSECHGHNTGGLIVLPCYSIFSYMVLNIWGPCKSLAVLGGLCGL